MGLRVCLITGSRAEYNRQYWLIKELLSAGDIDLKLIVTGAHLNRQFGYTLSEIEQDNFPIFEKIDISTRSDTNRDIARSVSIGSLKFSKVFARINPDIVLIYGDRFELLSVACACVCMQIPIGHIGGGQLTEGAIDDQIRHMLTKAAHLHFVANYVFADRVKQLGEEPWRVCVSGSPALDAIKKLSLLPRARLSEELGINLNSLTALVTFHPVTLDLIHIKTQVKNLLAALEEAHARFGLNYLITYPNIDSGSAYIVKTIKKFAQKHKDFAVLREHLGQLRYLSLLSYVPMIIGNSSSGIVESPSFGIPVVNIGDRQKGRIFAKNIIQADYSKESILRAIGKALKQQRRKQINPYGDGESSRRIVRFIRKTFAKKARAQVLRKKFIGLK